MIKIYEVMAIENNLPLFFLNHIRRFKNSISRYKDYSEADLIHIIKNLMMPILGENGIFNLKITYNVENEKFYILKTEPRKPLPELYITGGTVGLFKAERDNPLIKQENNQLREISDIICKKNSFYDLLLVNKDGNITEGSRSNFLLIDSENRIITSPIGEALNGVTRNVIFDICRDRGIIIIEKDISKDILASSKSLIITGTSPEILPISTCEKIHFDVKNSLISLLQKEFNLRKSIDMNLTREIFKK